MFYKKNSAEEQINKNSNNAIENDNIQREKKSIPFICLLNIKKMKQKWVKIER